jgi:hypothetical protein
MWVVDDVINTHHNNNKKKLDFDEQKFENIFINEI